MTVACPPVFRNVGELLSGITRRRVENGSEEEINMGRSVVRDDGRISSFGTITVIERTLDASAPKSSGAILFSRDLLAHQKKKGARARIQESSSSNLGLVLFSNDSGISVISPDSLEYVFYYYTARVNKEGIVVSEKDNPPPQGKILGGVVGSDITNPEIEVFFRVPCALRGRLVTVVVGAYNIIAAVTEKGLEVPCEALKSVSRAFIPSESVE